MLIVVIYRQGQIRIGFSLAILHLNPVSSSPPWPVLHLKAQAEGLIMGD